MEPHIPYGRLRIGGVGLASTLAAFAEAGVLVLVIAAAVAITDGKSDLAVSIGGLEASTSLDVGLATALGLALIGVCGHVWVARETAAIAADAITSVRLQAVRRFAQASWSRQSRERQGAIQELISSVATQIAQLGMSYAVLAASLAGLLSLVLAVVLTDLVVALFVALVGGLLFVGLRPVGLATRRLSEAALDENTRLAEQVSAWTRLAKDLRVFGVEDAAAEPILEATRVASTKIARARFAARLGAALYKDAALILLVAAVWGLHLADGADLGSAGAVVVMMVRLIGYAQQLQGAFQGVHEYAPALEMVQDRLEDLSAARNHFGDRDDDCITSLGIENVSYRYDDGRTALSGIKLEIGSGEAIGIVGPSGAGKSTLVELILRQRVPTEGVIRVSGRDYREIAPEAWSSHLAYVPQEPILLEASVFENIRFYRQNVPDSAVIEAAKRAYIYDEIAELPDGFETRLGPQGLGLSGGQKQRLALARALAGSPKLLVLDEPTSALDARSERLVQATLESLVGQITLVIVAHRLSTLETCNRVVALRAGQVVTIGSLAEAAMALETRTE